MIDQVGLNEVIQIKHFTQGMVQNRCSMLNGYYCHLEYCFGLGDCPGLFIVRPCPLFFVRTLQSD